MSCNYRMIEAPSQSYATDLLNVGSTAVQVASRDPYRRSVTLMVDPDATSDGWLVSDAGGRVGRGLRLTPGSAFSMNTAAAVYVVAGATIKVYVITESGEIG